MKNFIRDCAPYWTGGFVAGFGIGVVMFAFKLVDCDVEIDDDDGVTDLSDADEFDKLLIHLLSELLAAREKNDI